MKVIMVTIVVLALLVASFFTWQSQQPEVEDSITLPVTAGENIAENKYFAFLKEVIDSTREETYSLAAMLDDACSSCASGKLLWWLDDLHKNHVNLNVVAVLPQEFTDNDFDNFTHNYGFALQFMRRSPELERLAEVNEVSFRRAGVVAVIALLNHSGKIVLVHAIRTSDSLQEIRANIAEKLSKDATF